MLTINPHVYKSLPYDTLRDFAPITQTVTNTIVLVVHPSLPARSVKELVALAQVAAGRAQLRLVRHRQPDPPRGRAAARSRPGIKMVHVPYKGETPAVTELIGGQVVLLFAVSSAAAPHIKSGRHAAARHRRREARRGLARHADHGRGRLSERDGDGVERVPRAGRHAADIVEKIQRDSARHLLSAELRERLSALGADPVGSTPDQFAAFIRSETEKFARVVKMAGIYQTPVTRDAVTR